MPGSRQKGSDWERVAESFLKKRGLKTLTKNFHGRFGEIDLVMLDEQTLVFTEVRYRSGSTHGSGADSVTRTKQKRIVCAARRYLQYHSEHRFRSCRFDVVSIGTDGGRTILDWIPNAFDAG